MGNAERLAEIERRHEKVEDAIFDGPVCRTCRHIDGAAVSYPCDAAIVLVEIQRLQNLGTPELLDENQALMEEIRRLREELGEFQLVSEQDKRNFDKVLAAHRAVVERLSQLLYEARNPMLPNGETLTVEEMYAAWQKAGAVVRALEAAINRIECRHETRGLLPCAACCEALYVARSDPAVQAALDALVTARTERQ